MDDELPEATYQLTSIDVPKEIGAAAAWWGIARKTLGQRWIPAGEAANDLCPYRQPELMGEWYRRIYPGKPVPPAVLKRLESLPGTESAPEKKPATQVTLQYSEAAGEESLVERYRKHELAMHRRYLRAVEDPEIDERTRRTYREEWETAADARRLQEQSAKKTGDMLPVSAFDLAFREFASRLPQALANALPANLSKQDREAIVRATLAQLPDHLEPLAA